MDTLLSSENGPDAVAHGIMMREPIGILFMFFTDFFRVDTLLRLRVNGKLLEITWVFIHRLSKTISTP